MADTYTIERSATVSAPPQTVYELVADFKNWQEWSPWEELDPNLQRTYSGSDSGVGAVYEWSGKGRAGQGRMEITEATPGSTVRVKLDFVKPFKSSNKTTFSFTPEGAGTHVLWSMTGPRPVFLRLFSFLFNPEKMIGPDFEKGLAKLGQAASS